MSTESDPEAPPEQPRVPRRDTQGFGIAVLTLIDVLAIYPLTMAVDKSFGGYATLTLLCFFGAVHALWGLPLAGYFKHAGRPRAARGVLLALGVTFLLTSACFGLFQIG